MKEFLLWLAALMDSLSDAVLCRKAQESDSKPLPCKCKLGNRTVGNCHCEVDSDS